MAYPEHGVEFYSRIEAFLEKYIKPVKQVAAALPTGEN